MRIAGAPISWGVCEVPDWGVQLAPDRVLAEMRELGMTATEFGPQGWLPEEPARRSGVLSEAGLQAVGAFVPVVLHDPGHDPVPGVAAELEAFEAAGGDTLVLAAATGADGYDERPELTEAQWRTLLANLDRVAELARSRGIRPTLHPHVGTLIERRDEVLRVLDGSSMPICLDTGHLLIGGTDPAWLAETYADRIAHVHAKDVSAALAEQVRSGELTYTEAVRQGIYVPLGAGDVDVAAIVAALDGVGYDGWYVLEQDTILAAEPAAGTGPVEDVRASLAFLRSLSDRRA
ncbi:TIM barrel protein [Agromyces aerolatus]|uniref:TIM barrel protein n=1 Tax=Agromyces sp. LY-1074 TaxID=3074080 RepID=UPI00285B7049|nr:MULTISPECIES: TIM barrel protein [unclassified Agromyces]MDR5699248.1 TIM barrel protein [Agromyces sp. LY-1074]MDR5705544.1 TIM barrel protein [Agromyces sp. LY-1358]